MLALLLPFFLLMIAGGALSVRELSLGLSVISGLMVLFTFRKVFQPLHYDIGDKSAYQ
ncbi:MAG: hypothetical protein JSV21_06340 [Nitrospirota bacterium]|nr:MAG: hypothetical protein JSV21_06340 [Nitrospirota bacterium]